jgi:uncharacterized protein (TIGR00369 family)
MAADQSPMRLTVEQAQRVVDSAPFGPWWGFVVESVEPGRARVRLPWRGTFLRPGQVLQGGCSMTLADVAFWLALMSLSGPDDPSVTLELKTNFLRGARSDLRSTAEVLSAGRRVVYGQAWTRDDEDRLIAHHTVTYLRPGR